MDFHAETQKSAAAMILAETPDTTPMTLYRCYGADGSLLYIGITNDFDRRMRNHRNKSRWFGLVDRTEEQKVIGRYTAQHLEERAIKAEKPAYNRQHNGGRDEWI